MLQVSQERVQVSLDASHLFGPWMKITSRHGAKPGWPKNQFKVDRRSCASSWRCLLEAMRSLWRFWLVYLARSKVLTVFIGPHVRLDSSWCLNAMRNKLGRIARLRSKARAT